MNLPRILRVRWCHQTRFLSSAIPTAKKRDGFNRFLLVKFEQMFASKRDLREFLGDVIPIKSEAVLSKMLYPSGRWVVEVADFNATKLVKKAKMDPFERLSVQFLTPKEIETLSTSGSQKIFRNILRLRSTGDIKKADVHYIFEEFGVTYDSIRSLNVSNDNFPDFLVTFDSFNSALNAHKQKDGLHVGGHNISLTLYDI